MLAAAHNDPPLPLFDWEGHRGARGLLPENTIPAMRKALELGVTTLEMDVHISQDKQVLLSHDPYINPEHELLPSGEEIPLADALKYPLYQMPYQKIKAFDVGSKFYNRFPEQTLLKTHKPLLAEVIDHVQAYLEEHQLPQVFYNIETKSTTANDNVLHPEPEEFVKLLVQVLKTKRVLPYAIIQSFDVRTLQILRKSNPQVYTSLLVENDLSFEANLKELGFIPTIYSPDQSLVNPGLVASAHEKGIKVIPWTVNTVAEMEKLIQMGVDGLISDYPNLFKSVKTP